MVCNEVGSAMAHGKVLDKYKLLFLALRTM